MLNAKDLVPLSNSPAEIRNAANALYDVAAAWLGWHGQVQESYQVDALGLRHIVGGQVRLRVGDRLRLRFRGIAEDVAGGGALARRVWRDIDRDVWLLGYKRTFSEDGTDRWALTVSTVDRETPSDEEVVAKALEDLWQVQTAKRPYTFVETIGPYVESVAAGSTARVPVVLDQDVTWLHRATLRVRKRRVKSNVTGAAAGGGQTATSTVVTISAGGGVTSDTAAAHAHAVSSTTTPAGGGHTSESGSPHTHAVTGKTTQPGGLHFHQVAQYGQTSAWSQPGYIQTLIMQTGPLSGPNYGFIVGRNGVENTSGTLVTQQTQAHEHAISGFTSESESTHKHSVLHHTHSVTGQTAIAGGSHAHSLPTHTHATSPHNHEIADHTHALVYGVFLGPHPNAPQMTVAINGSERTVELGGPWDGDFTADITPYLVDGQGQPLRQSNSIEIGSAQLMDAEVVVRLMATTHSTVPVG